METEDDAIRFAKLWASMQEPKVFPFKSNYGWSLTNLASHWDVNRLSEAAFKSEHQAWKKLAELVGLFRRSLEPAIMRMRGGE